MRKLIMAVVAAGTVATSLIATSAPTYAQQCQWIRTASGFINNCWGAQSNGQRCQWISTASGFIRNCW
jgi:hypothetical protein